jgi:subtilisin-like proprotein convertase family protein
VPLGVFGFTIAGSALVIDQDIAIGDLNVNLNLAYPDVADLILILVSPRGTATSLSFLDGAEGDGFINTTFDDEADLSITAGESPFTGSFRPNDPLSGVSQILAQFDGESAQGTWWLFVENFAFTNSTGALTSWSLDIKPAASGQPPDGNQPPVANSDSIDMTTGGPLTFDASVLLANDFDPDGDPITIIGVQSGSGGSAELNGDGTITYTPQQNFVGVGDFTYVISDGFTTATAQVTVNVLAQTLWHNRSLAFDVDADGQVTANDVISIINVINVVGATSLLGLAGTFQPKFYLDVTADNYVGADDVLAVINYINDNPDRPSGNIVSQTAPATTDIDAALLSLLTEGNDKKK